MLISVTTCYGDYPLGKGRIALVGSYNYFYSNKYFDDKAKLIKYPSGDFFNSSSYSLSFITGIGRRIDFNVYLPFLVQTVSSGGFKRTNSGLGDASAGLSFHFPSVNQTKSLTLKAGVIFPFYQNDTISSPFLGFASKGIQLGAAYSFVPFEETFANLEFTYTRFLDASEGPDQYRGAFTLSKMLTVNTTLSGNFAHMVSRSANTNFNQNISINKNFEGGTIGISLTHRVTRTITPSIHGLYTLYGKNMGLGLGASFFLTVRIP